jgi:hypothetical protein
MAAQAIHVVPDDNFDDWAVRADIGQDFATTAPEKPPNGWRDRARARGRTRRQSAGRKNEANAFCKKLGRPIFSAMIPRNRATPC